MNAEPVRPGGAARARARLVSAVLMAGTLAASACSSSASSSPAMATASPTPMGSATKPNPDPRVGLAPGTVKPVPWDTTRRMVDRPAAQAAWNMRLLAHAPKPMDFAGQTNSDLAFKGSYVFQGNYDGFMVWDVSDPTKPALVKGYVCPASQSDVSVFRNLLFVSGEGTGGRLDCKREPLPDTVSHERLRGIRIFDISDVRNPKYIANVQTCRGSHTHSLGTQPGDDANVYVYVSGSSTVRPAAELAGCNAMATDANDPTSPLFRIEVIQVPLANPAQARIVSSPRVFAEMTAAPRRGEAGSGGGGGAGRNGTDPRAGPNQCHDITLFPAAGYAGGACQGYGLLLDIRDIDQPKRLFAVADTNFATWHSVTFSNDGRKVLFTDEWGGGGAPRCRESDPEIWGGNAIFDIVGDRLVFRSYYKMTAPQTELENCVAHNGSLIPVPGRDIKVQGWYQGGISVFDWTDSSNPYEIAYFDRGPYDATRMRSAGTWSVYWYNGYLYNSEYALGLDVLELLPNGHLTQNELDAARTVRLDEFNVQHQPRFEWPPSFALARAYLDQLQRSNGLAMDRITAAREELTRVERLSGGARRDPLTQLATRLDGDAAGARDGAKVRTLAAAVRQLAGAQD